jgi:integrase
MSVAQCAGAEELPLALPPDTSEDHFAFEIWLRWCEARGRPALPVDNAELVLFFAAHRRRWAGSSMWNVAIRICRRAMTLDSHAQLSFDVRQMITWITRIDGDGVYVPVRPLLPELAREVMANLAVPDPNVECLLDLIALRRGVAFSALPHVEGVHVRAHRTGWRVDADGISFSLQRTDPVHELAGRLGAELPPRPGTQLAARLWRIRSALSRAGFDADKTPPAGLAHYLGSLEAEDFAWLVRWCNPYLALRLRDSALIGVGVGAARRGTELMRLDRPDIEPVEDGFRCTFRYHKAAMDGSAPIVRIIAHIDHIAGGRRDGCPACALTDWLEVSDRRWPNLTMVFPTLGAIEAGPGRLQVSGMRGAIRRSVARVDDGAEHYGVRSLRRGAATGAYRSGCDVETIASELTGHEDPEHTVKYIAVNLDYQHPL